MLPRLGVKPGPVRFFLLSVTYGTKGYRFSPPENRERNLGLEIGLNLEEILHGIGVPERKWWGKALYVIVTHIRFVQHANGGVELFGVEPFREERGHKLDWSGSDGPDGLHFPLLEAKMVHHFDHRFGTSALLARR